MEVEFQSALAPSQFTAVLNKLIFSTPFALRPLSSVCSPLCSTFAPSFHLSLSLSRLCPPFISNSIENLSY